MYARATGPSGLRLAAIVVLGLLTAACAARGTVAPVAARPSPFPLVRSPFPARPAPEPRTAGSLSMTAVIDTALGFRGVPYRLGGDSPDRGFDCSGFIRYVLAQHALVVPRTAAEQYRIGRTITPGDIRAGDLVFFTTVAPGASHVGLALDGERFIHAPASTGVVRIEPLATPYWRERFIGARRLFSE